MSVKLLAAAYRRLVRTNGTLMTIMLTLVQTIILGIIEGVTEFLPISSTGHLILAAKLMQIESTEFLKSFEIFIQLGAILAVVALYARRLMVNWRRLSALMLAFLPTGVIGLFAYKYVKTYFLGNSEIVAWSLLIGGVVLLVFEYFQSRRSNPGNSLEYLTYKDAILIGMFQSIAIIPGVSRAAATIIGALLLGYKREAAVEFSFLLAIPTMVAASAFDLYKNTGTIGSEQFGLLSVGFVAAFVVALPTVLWLLKYIKTHSFTTFGIYRILVGIMFLFII